MNEGQLKLAETYQFDVKVNLADHFFRGVLLLSPQKNTLTVTGEISEGREIKVSHRSPEFLACSNVALNFLLVNLKSKGFFWTVLERHPKPINAFEISYEIEYIICSKSSLAKIPHFSGFEFDSPSLDLWVGETTIQREIIDNYHKNTLFAKGSSIAPEFASHVNGLGVVAIDYSTSLHYSTSDFSAGIKFPPKFVSIFDTPKTSSDVMGAINQLCDLLSVALGHRISLQAIRLIPAESNRYNNSALYFSQPEQEIRESLYAVFPLGANLTRNEFGLPAFPAESFDLYFSKKNIQTHFKKYIKYQDLKNPEEQFLGYFRLLEKLTASESMFVDEKKLDALINRAEKFFLRHFDNEVDAKKLLKQISRTNKSKSNTAGCIVRLIKEIPGEITKDWVFQKKDVEKICKLRNDLTHANEFEPDPSDIKSSTKFVEILLLFALFKEIGVSTSTAALIMPRVQGYHLLKPLPQPIFSSPPKSDVKFNQPE